MTQPSGPLFVLTFMVLAGVLTVVARPISAALIEHAKAEIFDTIWETARDKFYDSAMNGVDWPAAREQFRPRALAAETQDEFADAVNDMLGQLKTSHTYYFTRQDPKYYQLLGVFESAEPYAEQMDRVRQSLPAKEIGYTGIGIFVERTQLGLFVSAVLDGAPAHDAGIRVGDRLVSAGGEAFHPIRPFQGQAGKRVCVTIQRRKDGPLQTVSVKPRLLLGADMFMHAMQNSVQVVEVGDYKIGYVHVWSYSGSKYHELLEQLVLAGKLRGADALLLDMRDGWGGASAAYLDLFNHRIPSLVMKRRGAEPIRVDRRWRKPVALLINGGVRSGKEVVAHGFKRGMIGPVVGTRTAGSVVAGSLHFMPDQSVLYLAVADVLVDGKRLEGVGVAPTVEVLRPIPFSEGRDPQRDAGLAELGRILGQD